MINVFLRKAYACPTTQEDFIVPNSKVYASITSSDIQFTHNACRLISLTSISADSNETQTEDENETHAWKLGLITGNLFHFLIHFHLCPCSYITIV